MIKRYILLLAIFAFSLQSRAQLQYDTSFNGTGYNIVDMGDNFDVPFDVVKLPDGKFIIGGVVILTDGWKSGLARFNSDGSLDTTFGVNGRVILEFSGFDYSPSTGIALTADQKILMHGDHAYSSDQTRLKPSVVRLNYDGTIDTNFGENGIAQISLPSGLEYSNVLAMTQQADGKILICGNHGNNTIPWRPFICRFNVNGTLDTTFGTNGLVSVSIPNTGENNYFGLEELSDGNIIAAGSVTNTAGDQSNFFVSRYSTLGAIDTTFGNNGHSILNVGSGNYDRCNVMRKQPDGKLVIGGSADINGGSSIIIRLNQDGNFDTSFDTDGILIPTQIGIQNSVEDFAFDGDHLVVASTGSLSGDAIPILTVVNMNNGVEVSTASFNNGGKKGSFRGVTVVSPGIYVACGDTFDRDYMIAKIKEPNLGVEEIKESNGFVLYPNPTENNITIRFNEPSSEPFKITILDTAGREVYSKLISSVHINEELQISMAHMARGTYLFRVRKSKVSQIIKVQKR